MTPTYDLLESQVTLVIGLHGRAFARRALDEGLTKAGIEKGLKLREIARLGHSWGTILEVLRTYTTQPGPVEPLAYTAQPSPVEPLTFARVREESTRVRRHRGRAVVERAIGQALERAGFEIDLTPYALAQRPETWCPIMESFKAMMEKYCQHNKLREICEECEFDELQEAAKELRW